MKVTRLELLAAVVIILGAVFLLYSWIASAQEKYAPIPTPTLFPSNECVIIDQHVDAIAFDSFYRQRRQYGKVTWAIDPQGNYTLVTEESDCGKF